MYVVDYYGHERFQNVFRKEIAVQRTTLKVGLSFSWPRLTELTWSTFFNISLSTPLILLSSLKIWGPNYWWQVRANINFIYLFYTFLHGDSEGDSNNKRLCRKHQEILFDLKVWANLLMDKTQFKLHVSMWSYQLIQQKLCLIRQKQCLHFCKHLLLVLFHRFYINNAQNEYKLKLDMTKKW